MNERALARNFFPCSIVLKSPKVKESESSA